MRIYIYLIFIITILSCKQNKFDSVIENKNESQVRIEVSTDTIEIDKYVRGVITLMKPHFESSNSRIALVLETNENYVLKEDLSNEYQIPIEVFQNLADDSINQQWFKEYDSFKSAAFGKKFNKSGNNQIRGYVLEYLTEEPPLDSIFPKDKVRKYYFEKDIYVLGQ